MKKIKKNARCSERRIYQLDAEGSDFMVAQLVDIDFYPRMSEETLALMPHYGFLQAPSSAASIAAMTDMEDVP